MCIYIYIYIYIYLFDSSRQAGGDHEFVRCVRCTPSPPIKSFDFRGFDSSKL